MKTKKIIIVGIIIMILIIGIFWFFGININPFNKHMSVGAFIFKKFGGLNGDLQYFEIEKIVDESNMHFEDKECEEEFLKRNPTFNENTLDEEETYYCKVNSTNFYKSGINKFHGSLDCTCYYKK